MLVGNQEAGPSGSDSGGLLADLLEGARRRNLSTNSLAAYERTWTRFLAWAAGRELRIGLACQLPRLPIEFRA